MTRDTSSGGNKTTVNMGLGASCVRCQRGVVNRRPEICSTQLVSSNSTVLVCHFLRRSPESAQFSVSACKSTIPIPTRRCVLRHVTSQHLMSGGRPPHESYYSVLTFLHTSRWNPPIHKHIETIDILTLYSASSCSFFLCWHMWTLLTKSWR